MTKTELKKMRGNTLETVISTIPVDNINDAFVKQMKMRNPNLKTFVYDPYSQDSLKIKNYQDIVLASKFL